MKPEEYQLHTRSIQILDSAITNQQVKVAIKYAVLSLNHIRDHIAKGQADTITVAEFVKAHKRVLRKKKIELNGENETKSDKRFDPDKSRNAFNRQTEIATTIRNWYWKIFISCNPNI